MKPFDNCTELLSIICFDFDCVVIFGDDAKDRGTKELCCVLDNCGLTQHVTEPTHNKGHTLGFITSKGLNISEVVVTDDALSDHSCVFFESAISVQTKVQTELTKKQCVTLLSLNR